MINPNLIVCPICVSPYFHDAERYLQIYGGHLPHDVHRRCMDCGFEICYLTPIAPDPKASIEAIPGCKEERK
jgi:hypothetical protein